MARARFGILGTLEVTIADDPVELNAMQLRRLLCALLLTPGRPVSQSTLVEWMWPETGGSDAARPLDPLATLRVYTSRLRRVLPPDSGPHGDVRGYRLDVSEDDIDAGRFEQLLSRSAREPSQAVEALREALGLWRGSALEEFNAEPWAVGAAVRLGELRLGALERLYDARLALGEHAQLCGELEHVIDENPLREHLWAQLMLALYRSGRQAESLGAYRRLRGRLVEDLGIEPSRELAELEAAVLRQDSALDHTSPSTPGPGLSTTVGAPPVPTNIPHQLTSFVGRDREMAEVRHLAATSRMVTLTGAGGAGNTRLALQLGAELLDATGGGVWLFELAALREAAEVEPALATVLGVMPRAGGTVLDALLEALHGEQMLLLIDNCEHLVSPAPPCAKRCSAPAPGSASWRLRARRSGSRARSSTAFPL